MQVERNAEKYYADILQLIKSFHNESLKEYETVFDERVLLENFEKYKDNAFLLVIDGKCQGLLAGISATMPINNCRIFQEVIWYISKRYRKYGVLLLKEVKRILKEEGYRSWVMVLMHNSKTEKLDAFYKAQGFKPFETHYIRSL